MQRAEYIAFKCFAWISEQTATFALYSTNRLVFTTEVECLLRGTDWYNTDRFRPYRVK